MVVMAIVVVMVMVVVMKVVVVASAVAGNHDVQGQKYTEFWWTEG